jgi:2-polyprenyl-3-methyl-5-hydroxy-6-metoxy-1,4-benzoquinol methylase
LIATKRSKNVVPRVMNPATTAEEAWDRVKQVYPDSTWFGGTHLEENKPRLTRMLGDVMAWHPPGTPARIVDVGCFNGFLCYAFGQLGYQTAGIDAIDEKQVPERARILGEVKAPCYAGSFNELDPFAAVPQAAFDVAILGEVIEHIVNHPVGFARAVGRLLRPGGRLILTTPNPYTLANAVRVIRGQSTCWGDGEFASLPKFDPSRGVITYEGIHYREYGRQPLLNLLTEAGFQIERHQYLAMGAARRQHAIKRLAKSLPLWRWLAAGRLFGMTHYVVARWP